MAAKEEDAINLEHQVDKLDDDLTRAVRDIVELRKQLESVKSKLSDVREIDAELFVLIEALRNFTIQAVAENHPVSIHLDREIQKLLDKLRTRLGL